MTSEILKLLEKSRKLRAAATPGPFETYHMGDPRTTNQNHNRTKIWAKRFPKRADISLLEMVLRSEMDIDADFIIHACNTSEAKDKIIEIAMSVLENYLVDIRNNSLCLIKGHHACFWECENIQDISEALDSIEELAKEVNEK